jgi:anaphase-promoting complex subunit 3
MELFSTVLFHLSKEVDLAYLAHEMVDLDWLAPQTWCVIGNSFASQHEHDQAIACFQRAIQLDPRFAYAYSLQGLEHVENEEYDKARQCFMNALRANRRLYHAWLDSLVSHTDMQVWTGIRGVQVWQKSSCN